VRNTTRFLVMWALLTTALIGCDADEENPAGCGPDNCAGCCDPMTNICQAGSTSLACGANGAICLPCTGNTTCNAQTHQCDTSTETCSPQNCMGGCCSPQGICVKPGNFATACGLDGLLCKTCTGSQQCINGGCEDYNPNACNPTNCGTGCCLGEQCQPSPNASQCGVGGAPCQPCPASYTCNLQTGQCQDPNGCGDSCAQQNGCCLNNQCQSGTHPLACGSAGLVCDTCDVDETCENQVCKTGTSIGDCTPFNCPTGCCDRDGRCHLDGAINEQFCGALGLGCNTCNTWEECTWGSCDAKQTSCNCGIGQCCKDGSCVAGNTDTQCGTNGVICDNCYLKFPPTTCTTSTYTCSGAPSADAGVDGPTTQRWRIRVNYIKFDCFDYLECKDDGDDPRLFLMIESGGIADETQKEAFAATSGEQTINFVWLSSETFDDAALHSAINIKLMDYDFWTSHELLESCTLTAVGTLPDTQILYCGNSTFEISLSYEAAP